MDEIVAYYDELSKDYDKDRFENSYGKFIDQQERKILQKLLIDPNEVVLDLPCGSGRFMNFAQIGIDGSSEMVKISKEKHPNKHIFQADAARTGLAESSVDSIISFHFFMHLNEEKTREIFSEFERILKPGGRIIFDIPSLKRRKLIRYKKTNWHGSFSLSQEEIKKINPHFTLRKSYGILMIPIHRIPQKMRPFFLLLDRILSNSFLKEYSSYQLMELIKK